MNISDTIRTDHLERLAVVYIRQSSPTGAIAPVPRISAKS